MPSGARTTEHGRPFRCGIIHSPTAARYSARSRLVTGSPSPASGHSALSGCDSTTPITSDPPRAGVLPAVFLAAAFLAILLAPLGALLGARLASGSARSVLLGAS